MVWLGAELLYGASCVWINVTYNRKMIRLVGPPAYQAPFTNKVALFRPPIFADFSTFFTRVIEFKIIIDHRGSLFARERHDRGRIWRPGRV